MANIELVSEWFVQSSQFEDFSNKLQVGDRIEFSRTKLYDHWAVYLGKESKDENDEEHYVVNRHGPKQVLEQQWDIMKEPLGKVWDESKARINNVYDKISAPFNQIEIKERALKAIRGDEEARRLYGKYNVFEENCETFATQAQNALGYLKYLVIFMILPPLTDMHFIIVGIIITGMAAAVEITKVLPRGLGLKQGVGSILGLLAFAGLRWFARFAKGYHKTDLMSVLILSLILLAKVVDYLLLSGKRIMQEMRRPRAEIAIGISALYVFPMLLNGTALYSYLTQLFTILYVIMLAGLLSGFYETITVLKTLRNGTPWEHKFDLEHGENTEMAMDWRDVVHLEPWRGFVHIALFLWYMYMYVPGTDFVHEPIAMVLVDIMFTTACVCIIYIIISVLFDSHTTHVLFFNLFRFIREVFDFGLFHILLCINITERAKTSFSRNTKRLILTMPAVIFEISMLWWSRSRV